jgi:hypothetical protein
LRAPRKEIDMKSMISASALLLLADLGLAPPAAAQAANPVAPQPVIGRPTTQSYGAPWHRRQQARLPSGQVFDPPATSTGMGADFDPYPPGYGLYSGGND